MSEDLPDILSESEEGFVDLVFLITRRATGSAGEQIFQAEGVHETGRVGLLVELSKDWKPGTLGEDIPTHSGSVTYRSLGGSSDSLLLTLDRLYGTDVTPSRMNASTTFAAITL